MRSNDHKCAIWNDIKCLVQYKICTDLHNVITKTKTNQMKPYDFTGNLEYSLHIKS